MADRARGAGEIQRAIVDGFRARAIPFARLELRALGAAAQRRRPGRRAQPCCAPAFVRSSTVIAEATTLATSDRLDGTIIVLLVLARLPNAPM